MPQFEFMKIKTAYISAGSNMGNKLENCKNGLESIADSGNSSIMAISGFYATEPVDYIDQDWFVNAVARIETALEPSALLEELRLIETRAGRVRDAIRFGPRTLDLDILLYDDIIIESPDLIIPHPRMHERRFVLKPICDIDGKTIHPVFEQDMESLLDLLDESAQRMTLC